MGDVKRRWWQYEPSEVAYWDESAFYCIRCLRKREIAVCTHCRSLTYTVAHLSDVYCFDCFHERVPDSAWRDTYTDAGDTTWDVVQIDTITYAPFRITFRAQTPALCKKSRYGRCIEIIDPQEKQLAVSYTAHDPDYDLYDADTAIKVHVPMFVEDLFWDIMA